jgi:hypothetical protein
MDHAFFRRLAGAGTTVPSRKPVARNGARSDIGIYHDIALSLRRPMHEYGATCHFLRPNI